MLNKSRTLAFVPEKLKPLAKNTLEWKLNRGGGIDKKDLIMLDMITNINKDGWKRPIYFSTTLSSSNYIGLRDHMVLEGSSLSLITNQTWSFARNRKFRRDV